MTFGAEDSIGCAVSFAVAAGAAVLFILVMFGWPLLLAVVDVVLVGVLVVVGLVARLLFGRPWTVEARSDGGQVHELKVVGWSASSVAMDAWARAIAAGRPEPPAARIG